MNNIVKMMHHIRKFFRKRSKPLVVLSLLLLSLIIFSYIYGEISDNYSELPRYEIIFISIADFVFIVGGLAIACYICYIQTIITDRLFK